MEGYIARDEIGGHLNFYTKMPKRGKNSNFWMNFQGDTLGLSDDLFPNLRWEDEPIKVKLTFEEL